MKITNCKTFVVEGIKSNWTLFKIKGRHTVICPG